MNKTGFFLLKKNQFANFQIWSILFKPMIPHVSWSFGSTFLMISGVQKHSEVVQHGFSSKKHEILMKMRRFSNLRLQDQYLTQNQCFSMVSGNWVGNRLSNTSEMIWKRRFWTCKSILDHLGTSESRKIWTSFNSRGYVAEKMSFKWAKIWSPGSLGCPYKGLGTDFPKLETFVTICQNPRLSSEHD